MQGEIEVGQRPGQRRPQFVRRRDGERARRFQRGLTLRPGDGQPVEPVVEHRRHLVDLDRAVVRRDLPRGAGADGRRLPAKAGQRSGGDRPESVPDRRTGADRSEAEQRRLATLATGEGVDVAERGDELHQAAVTGVGHVGDLDGEQPPVLPAGAHRAPPGSLDRREAVVRQSADLDQRVRRSVGLGGQDPGSVDGRPEFGDRQPAPDGGEDRCGLGADDQLMVDPFAQRVVDPGAEQHAEHRQRGSGRQPGSDRGAGRDPHRQPVTVID